MKQSITEKLISLFLVLILLTFSMGFCVLYSAATEFVADGIHSFYIGKTQPKTVIALFNDDFTELTVFKNGEKGLGTMRDWVSPYDENYTYNPAYEHADTLKKVIICDGVVSTGEYFCFECSNLETVEFSQTVVTVGAHSFRKTGLTSLVFPSKLRIIGERAFSGCHELTGNLVIPDSVREIGNYAFYNCNNLNGTLTLGSSLQRIGAFAFVNCSHFAGTLSFSASLESIGAYCFENCSSLSGELVLNEGLKHIGDGAFNHCFGFTNTELVIPSTVETIGGDTAYEVDAYSATPSAAPETYYNHASHVFYDFANQTLSSFKVADGNTYFNAVDGVLYTSDMKRLVAYPPSRECSVFEIPDGVEIIDEMAFGRTSYSGASEKLTTIIIPDSYVIKTNDDYPNTLNREAMCSLSSAIYVFSSVQEILVSPTNPNYISIDGCIYSKDGNKLICAPSGKTGDLFVSDSVNEIGYGAFSGCNMLRYIIIPSSVAIIGQTAFDYCNDAQIVGYAGSSVDSLKSKPNCSIHNFGDLNDDGEFTIADYNMLREKLYSDTSFNPLQSIVADYDYDGAADGFDLFYIDKLISLQS